MKNWAEMPEFMIKKVAIWQGFRLCFPSELWGLPYLAEEITSETENNIVQWQVVGGDDDIETPKETAPVVVEPQEMPDEKPEPEQPTETVETPKDEKPSTVDPVEPQETVKEVASDGEQDGNEWQKRLPANKVKQVQITWKKFAELNKWNAVDSDKKRRATMQKYFDVDSANLLTEDQANDFIHRIDQAIEKLWG